VISSHALPVVSFAIGMTCGIFVTLLVVYATRYRAETPFDALIETVRLHRQLGAATPSLLPFERSMMTPELFYLGVKLTFLKAIENAAENDKATFETIMQKVVAKIGTALDADAKKAAIALLEKEPVLAEFVPLFETELNNAVDSEFAHLESQAGGVEDLAVVKGELWVKAQIAATEAEIAGSEPVAPAAPVVSLSAALPPEEAELNRS
jgi:hypothetical protein